jgi:Domain of unknown function (DUF1877)
MGVVAYYARVNEADLDTLRRDPEQFWELSEMSWDVADPFDQQASEYLSVDKDYEVLSWLCSDSGRAHARYSQALIRVDVSVEDRAVFTAAVIKQHEAMGFEYTHHRDIPDDPVLDAIQGRNRGDDGKAIAGLGLASALFNPEESKELAAALNNLDETWLRGRFDVAEMEEFCMPSDYEESEFDELYLPQLKRLQALYNRAVAAGQHVIVAMC